MLKKLLNIIIETRMALAKRHLNRLEDHDHTITNTCQEKKLGYKSQCF